MPYTHLLFDLDHTLLDSEASAHAAFDATLRSVGVDDPVNHADAFARINGALWERVERGDITPNEVRTRRFEQFLAETGIEADPRHMADHYVEGLGSHGDLFPGALDLLDEVRTTHTLALVTNGIGEVQRSRVARLGLEPYFAAIVISGEVGVAKPAHGIFELVFDHLGGPSKDGALMIGDSLTSDIRGGNDFGIDTCWYEPSGSRRGDIIPTHTAASFEDILALV